MSLQCCNAKIGNGQSVTIQSGNKQDTSSTLQLLVMATPASDVATA
jgi:hypothetical protein